MALLKDIVRELLDALLDELHAKGREPIRSARGYAFGVLAFGVAVILLLSTNVALLAMLVNRNAAGGG